MNYRVVQAIDSGQARLGVVIPHDFSSDVDKGDARVLMLVDGSDPFTTQSAYYAANAIAQNYSLQLVLNNVDNSSGGGEQAFNPLTAHIQTLYNPDRQDLWFLVPGLIAMLLQTQTITLTALAVVRERELGTIEQILVTPIRPIELMLGKTVPNFLIAVINMLTIVLVGTLGFGVPYPWQFPPLFFSDRHLYLFRIGIRPVVSSFSQNQRQAQQLASMITFIGQVICGFVFPYYANAGDPAMDQRSISPDLFHTHFSWDFHEGNWNAIPYWPGACPLVLCGSHRVPSRSIVPAEVGLKDHSMQKSCQRLIALILKETMQLLRDRRTLMMVLGLPLIELFLFGYAVALTVYHIPTAIVDQNKTPQSRDFIQALVNSQYFDVTEALQSQNQIVDEMDAGHVKAGIVIPPDFPTRLENGNANVLILLDGSELFQCAVGLQRGQHRSPELFHSIDSQKDRSGRSGCRLAQASHGNAHHHFHPGIV